MVEVFKTNVNDAELAQQLIHKLLNYFSFFRVNFDLDDCDKILRVEGETILPEKVIELVLDHGCFCQVLD
ncbi:MAG: hypothetical protein H0V30_03005 [Chitinophagaceae bacterium]|nr:hypothetical protein [Chitinophagaceae bacterium]